jgi:hypothetical protein
MIEVFSQANKNYMLNKDRIEISRTEFDSICDKLKIELEQENNIMNFIV